jgi:hypothetical protein
MVMNPAGLGAKNDFAGEDRQQFIRLSGIRDEYTDTERER